MRTKVVFSGSVVLLLVVAAVGFIVSRDREVSANVYYYCWECAETAETGLGCVQVQYTMSDHLAASECPQGTFVNEGLCAVSCVNPSSTSSAASVASSAETSSVDSNAEGNTSSQSSELVLVITGIEEPPIYLLTAAGIIRHPVFLLLAAAVAGLLTYAFVRKR